MGDMLGKVRAGVVQASSVFMDREGTVDKAIDIIDQAADRGVEILVFPEGFIPSHPIWMHFHAATSKEALELDAELFRNSLVVGGRDSDRIAAAARRAGTWVVMGACEKRADTTGTMWNSGVHYSPDGEVAHVHRKLTPTLGERLVHAGGDGSCLRLPKADFGPISTLICAENSNPLLTFNGSAQYATVHAALWPNHFSPTQPLMRNVILNSSRSIAYQNGCYVLSAAGVLEPDVVERVGKSGEDFEWLRDPLSTGGSCIIAPTGEVLAGQAGCGDELLVADLDLDLLVTKRVIHDYAGHYNRPDVLSLVVRPQTRPLFDAPWNAPVEGASEMILDVEVLPEQELPTVVD